MGICCSRNRVRPISKEEEQVSVSPNLESSSKENSDDATLRKNHVGRISVKGGQPLVLQNIESSPKEDSGDATLLENRVEQISEKEGQPLGSKNFEWSLEEDSGDATLVENRVEEISEKEGQPLGSQNFESSPEEDSGDATLSENRVEPISEKGGQPLGSQNLESSLEEDIIHAILSQDCFEAFLEKGDQRLVLRNPESISEKCFVYDILAISEEDSSLKEVIHYTPFPLKRCQPALDYEVQLYFAVLERNSNKVKELLKYCDGTFKDKDGNTLLHIYATSEITKSLIQNTELDLNCKNNVGLTPLHVWFLCMAVDEDKIVECSISPEVFKEHYEIIKCLLEGGADCNIKESLNGNTVLHDAIYLCLRSINAKFPEEQWISLVQLLLSFNADPNTKNNHERTPLHKAVNLQFSSLARLLIQHGAELNVQDNFGNTPLHLLTLNSCTCNDNHVIDLAVFMMENGADPTLENADGQIPLHYAIYLDVENVVDLFLKFELSSMKSLGPKISNSIVHIVDKKGLNALHHAVGLENDTIAKRLIAHGADVNAVDKYGSSCLHYAAYRGNQEMIKLLKELGGNPELVDKNGNPPVTIALRRNYSKTVAALRVGTGQILQAGLLLPKYSFEEVTDRVIYSFKGDSVEYPNILSLINFNEDSKKFLQNVMKVEGVGRIPNISEVDEIRQAIEAYMNEVTKCMSSIDKRFKGQILKSGSVYEGTKVGDPNEFDYMFVLTEFERICSINVTEEIYDDVTIRKNPNKHNDEFDEFFEDNNLKCSEVMHRFVGIYTEAELRMTYKPFHANLYVFRSTQKTRESMKIKPGITTNEIGFLWCGAFYKYIIITADMVPAIRVKTWPKFAETDSQLLTEDIIKQGCHVVQKSDKWRLSFSLAEQSIMNRLSDNLRSAYIEAKVARDPRVTLATAVHRELEIEMGPLKFIAETEMIIDGRKLIPSYLLKLVLFDCIEECHKKGKGTSEITSATIYSKLDKCLSEKSPVPFFFMKKHNFLDKVFNKERPSELGCFAVSIINDFFRLNVTALPH